MSQRDDACLRCPRPGGPLLNARAPRVLIVNQHYVPEVAATAQYLGDLCDSLVEQGFEVEVLCGNGSCAPHIGETGKKRDGGGIKVRRLRSRPLSKKSDLNRVRSYSSFLSAVFVRYFASRRVDVTVFLTTPPLLPVIGLAGALLLRRRYCIWSMDVYPDAAIAAGILKAGSPSGVLLRWVGNMAYRRASFVISIGDYMTDELRQKSVPAARVHTVPLWVPPQLLSDRSSVRTWRPTGRRFVVGYCGNAGMFHDFGDILEAISLLRADGRFEFSFVGGGLWRERIESFVADRGIQHFTYRDHVPLDDLASVLASADAHLVSLRREFVGLAVPSKVYGIMAAERPVLFVGPTKCETAELVMRTKCGAVIDPYAEAEPAKRIADTLSLWYEDPDLRAAMGQRGRREVARFFNRELSCRVIAGLLRDLLGMEVLPSGGVRGEQNEHG